MDKKKDASSSSSSSRKSSGHKKLMLRVHIPVSGSSLFLPFGSWRGLGMFFSVVERSERQGEVLCLLCFLPSSAVWGVLGWGCTLQQAGPAHWRGLNSGVLAPLPCSAGSPGCRVRGTEVYPPIPVSEVTLTPCCTSALGSGFGTVCLAQFPVRLAARCG